MSNSPSIRRANGYWPDRSNGSPATVAKTVEKAFIKDPQAKRRVFFRDRSLEITQDEELAEETELMIEGVGFVSTTEAAPEKKKGHEEDEETKLPNMAITVYLDHLIVATHVDFIQDFIAHQGNGRSLGQADDYHSVLKALLQLGSKNDSFRFFSRTDDNRTGPLTTCSSKASCPEPRRCWLACLMR